MPRERPVTLSANDTSQTCAIVLLADGFEETDAIVVLGLLRQAGLYVKSLGLTSGLICSAHGVRILPDLTFDDLDRLAESTAISMVILPEGRNGLARLEADPRVHRLLRQVAAERGYIVTSAEGLRVPRAAAIWNNEPRETDNDHRMPVILREPGESLEGLALSLIRRLKQPP
jgi:putative intracellular protease/amidase